VTSLSRKEVNRIPGARPGIKVTYFAKYAERIIFGDVVDVVDVVDVEESYRRIVKRV
jgi:hypothetical protein